MIDLTKETNLLKCLALDSIYNVLNWYERVTIHQCMMDRFPNEELSERVLVLLTIIVSEDWIAPLTKYPEFDRETLHYHNAGALKPIEDYKKKNYKLTERILEL